MEVGSPEAVGSDDVSESEPLHAPTERMQQASTHVVKSRIANGSTADREQAGARIRIFFFVASSEGPKHRTFTRLHSNAARSALAPLCGAPPAAPASLDHALSSRSLWCTRPRVHPPLRL